MPPDDDRLRELLARHAIRELLVRYCRAVDRRDEALLRSVYHAGATHAYGGYDGDAARFAGIAIRELGRYDVTSHFLCNETIAFETEDAARCESYVLAVHRETRGDDARELTLALRYHDRVERRDDAWRIARRVAVYDWSRDQPMGPAWEGEAGLASAAAGRHDPWEAPSES